MGLDQDLFQGSVDPAYICGLCKNVLLNPITAGCKHIFCQTCVRRTLKSRTTRSICPSCSAKLTPNLAETSIEFKLKLLDLQISCSHKCGQVFILAELPDHAEICPNAPVECDFKSHGCKKTVKRCDLRRHHEECDFRFVECEACGYRTIYRDLFTHQSRVRCLEKKLKQQIIRERKNASKEVNKHREKLFRDNVRLEQHQRKSLLRHSKSMNYLYEKRLSRRAESESEFDYSPRGGTFLTQSRMMNHDMEHEVGEREDKDVSMEEGENYQMVNMEQLSYRVYGGKIMEGFTNHFYILSLR